MGTRSHTSTKKILKSKLFLLFGVRTRNSQFIERRDFLVSFLFSFEFLQQSSVSAAGSDALLSGLAHVNPFGPAHVSFYYGFLRDAHAGLDGSCDNIC